MCLKTKRVSSSSFSRIYSIINLNSKIRKIRRQISQRQHIIATYLRNIEFVTYKRHPHIQRDTNSHVYKSDALLSSIQQNRAWINLDQQWNVPIVIFFYYCYFQRGFLSERNFYFFMARVHNVRSFM